MSKEIVKKEETALSTHVEQISFGASEGDLINDYLIPRALLQQGLSERVTAGEAFMGDVVKSTTGEVFFTCNPASKNDNREILRVSRDNPARVVPLAVKLLWTLMEEINGKFEYRGSEPRTADNASLPIEFEKDGTKWRRYATIDIFALLESDILSEIEEEKNGGTPDLSKMLLPLYFSFRSSSLRAGKEFTTLFSNVMQLRARGKNIFPYQYSMPIWCEKTENDKGIFSVWKSSQSTKACSPEVQAKAKTWFDSISKGHARVDEAHEEDSTQSSGPTEF